MELRHLKTFQTILRSGSFVKAAEELQYAQSTITLHIQQLEADLGVKVFARRGKNIQLTTAGRALQEHANFLLNRSALLHQEMLELVAGKAGHLRLGSIEPVASLRLPKLLAVFCQQYPKIRLTLETGVTAVISQRVATGQLDLGICSPPQAKLGLNFEMLFDDPVALLIPQNHRLRQKPTIKVTDLKEERLLLTEADCPYRQMFEREITACGVNPFTGLEIMSLKAIQSMVQSGLGIGVMPITAIEPHLERTVVRQIERLTLKLPVGLVSLPEKTIPGLALDLFTKTIIDILKVEEA